MLLLRSEKRVNENDYYLIDDIRFSYDRKKILAHSHRYTPTRTKIDTMLVTEDPYMFDMLGATMYLLSLIHILPRYNRLDAMHLPSHSLISGKIRYRNGGQV